ncbi:hypothetical protein [Alkalilimnicola ehrlichii]|uniref:hypothetical protein n=1 Tax=Alkalilimnicola ehrlichii TaxID=351052 RepID=UPI0011C05757|nr:hypothetical protein [Alkalilimnicola ehrlichii]
MALVLLLASLLAVMVPRFDDVRLEAERIAYERQLAEMQTLLRLELASTLYREGWSGVGRLDGDNPAKLWQRQFGEAMPRYSGEFPREAAFAPGTWAYDPERQTITYRPRRQRDLCRADGAWPARPSYRIVVTYRQDSNPDLPRALNLLPQGRYSWRRAGEQACRPEAVTE